LCLIQDGCKPIFRQISTTEDVLMAVKNLRLGLTHYLQEWQAQGGNTVFSVEKQLSVGAYMSSLLFYVQMIILEVILDVSQSSPIVVMPLPIQLLSYMKRVYGAPTKPTREIVNHWKQFNEWEKRISQHEVDAWYLAKLARDVINKRWSYKLPSKEMKLVPWETLHE